ncbi:hypothetical protein HNV12_03185 [Methanococcoides sp. SA1]|nr:hypothetical protein [Methanococcoides sp. SA1]
MAKSIREFSFDDFSFPDFYGDMTNAGVKIPQENGDIYGEGGCLGSVHYGDSKVVVKSSDAEFSSVVKNYLKGAPMNSSPNDFSQSKDLSDKIKGGAIRTLENAEKRN